MRAGWDRKHWVGRTTRIIVAGVMLVDPRLVAAGLPRQEAAPSVAGGASSFCNFYPFALSSETVAGQAPGAVLPDIFNGTQPGGFGWLTWTGARSEVALAASLAPPGDSDTYVNPNDPSDHVISGGDWVRGRPGVSDTHSVRAALDYLETLDITVPVWDQAMGQGAISRYRVLAFARVRLLDYRLAGQNRITARFLGYTACGSPIPTRTPTDTPAPVTAIATASPTHTPVPSDTPTAAPTVTHIPTSTQTATFTSVPTDTPTSTAVATDTPTVTATASQTRTPTPSTTPTDTATQTSTSVPTDSPTATASSTATASDTPTATATHTASSAATALPTNTPPPTDTPRATTTLGATATPTHTATATPVPTDTPTATPSETPTRTATPASTSTPSSISVTPTSLDFGTLTVGGTSALQTVFLQNTSQGPAIIDPLAISGDFVIGGTSCHVSPDTLVPGITCYVDIVFKPTALGTRTGTLTITSSAGAVVVGTVALTGIGTRPTISVTPTSLDFGTLTVGGTSAVQTVFLQNTSQGPASLDVPAISGDFVILGTTCHVSPDILVPGITCYVDIVFKPTALGTSTGALTITSSDAVVTGGTVVLKGNRPPVADAGADQTAGTASTVQLDGNRSNDPDGDPVVFQWSFFSRPANSAAVLVGADTAMPSFIADLPGTYMIQLTVADSSGAQSALDKVVITAAVLDFPPTITSKPVTSGEVAQPYRYDVHASDPDAADIITFSLTAAPAGMTIDPVTGVIQWTPAGNQGGRQPVTVRVQDQGGMFATQDFVVQVSSPANHAPVAVDDAYEVRVNESLSVGAPGVLGNDSDLDNNLLTATLLTQPTNGTLQFNPDGSFTYTPSTLRQGELVLAENVNLATHVPGVTVRASAAAIGGAACGQPQCAVDDDLNTIWASNVNLNFLEVEFPQDVTVSQLRVIGIRSPGLTDPSRKIQAGVFQLFGADGTVLLDTGGVSLTRPDGDVALTVPSVAGVRRVRFTDTADGGGDAVGLSELQIIGSTLLRRERVVPDPDLVHLVPTRARASSAIDFNVPENAIDENLATSWYGTGTGDFFELVFPVDVTVTEVHTVNPGGRPDGFGTSLTFNCSGRFELFDASDTVLFESGVVSTPTGFVGQEFSVPVPSVAGIRRIRYTVVDCTGTQLPPGFAEVRVFGSAGQATPPTAFDVKTKFPALTGRRAHSTAIVANLTDSDGDGRVDRRDIPSIVVPVESLDSQLTGEIKVLSGDDGRELVTLGAPNQVSPWSEVAVGDIDGDGVPDVVAVHSDGNHLIAFTFGGGVIQGDLTRRLMSLTPNVSSTNPFSPGPSAAVDGDLSTDWFTGFGDTPSLGSNTFYEITFPQDITVTEIQLFGARDGIYGSGSSIAILAGIFQLFAADGTVLFDSGVVNTLAPDFDVTLAVPNIAGVRRMRFTATAAHNDRGPNGFVGLSELKVIGSAVVATGVPSLKWLSNPNPMPSFFIGSSALIGGAVSIANLDGGPRPHIVVGASVFDADGKLIGDGRTLGGTTAGTGLRSAMSAIADVDLDGIPEIIAGPTAYRLVNGQLTKVWQRTDRPDGYVAIGNFDDDPQAEIVVVADGLIYMLNHDGTDAEVWNPPTHAPVPIPVNSAGGAGPAFGQAGPPLIVDVDGDGIPESGIATSSAYILFNRDGTVRWQSGISDHSSHSTGSVAFDFDGDGEVEIVYRDEQFLRIFRGGDGVLLAKVPIKSSTWAEQPVVVDVDNDGHADIVVSSDQFNSNQTAVYVLQDIANKWTRTRRIWNQHGYHITNVNEDGTIPQVEMPNWLVPGLNNFRVNAFVPGEGADQADSFTYFATDGGLDSSEATVRITIRTPNGAPTIISTPPTNAAVGLRYIYGVQVSDPEAGDVFMFSLPTAPAGMTIDPNFGLIQWTPTSGQLGSQDVVVKVQDPGGLLALQRYTVQVANPVTVPTVVGQTQAAAGTTITTAGLAVGTVSNQNNPTVPAGTVISQNPLGGTLAVPGSAVHITVSLGPPPPGTVPNVVGETQTTAEANITAAGFQVGTVSGQNSTAVPLGIVISQDPTAGTIAMGGSPVNIVVSLGPPPGDIDQDGDGFTPNQGDCNDTDANINPSASDIPSDGIDQNCNGADSIPGDDTPPTASIESPADLAVVTMPTDITGSASDANFLRYWLEVASVDSNDVTVIGSGTNPVMNGLLGRLDPTLLENGLYRVRLVAEDINGQTSVDEKVYRVSGEVKAGVFALTFIDLQVPVSGIPITVLRSYDSRVKTQRDLGVGWSLRIKTGTYQNNRPPGQGWVINDRPFLGTFLPCIGGTLETRSHLTEVRLSDREFYRFALTVTNGSLGITGACEGTASFQFVDGSTPGARLESLDGTAVLYLRGGTDTVLDREAFFEGTQRVYDPQRVRLTTVDGRIIDLDRTVGITRTEDLNGNSISITPGGIVHSSGKSIAFQRDEQGRIVRMTDPAGQTTEYVYNARGDLVTVTDPLIQASSFTYDTAHNLLDIADARGLLSRSEYDAEGRLISVTDASGNRVAFDHILSARQEVITDRLGNTSLVTYDDRGNVLSRTDPLGQMTTYTYDARDNLLSQTDPLGNTTAWTYDANDNKLSETDPLGNTRRFTYNSRSQVLTRTDPLGNVTHFAYDNRGNLLSETDPLGQTTTHTYDPAGNRTSSTDPLGNRTLYVFDSHGNEILVTDPLGGVTNRSFDANGNSLSETTTRTMGSAPQTQTTTYTYDARNQWLGVTNAEGGVTHVTYTVTGKFASFTDPRGQTTTHTYDSLDRMIRTTYADGTSEVNSYDAEGRLAASTDRAGRVTRYTNDALGRRVQTSYPDGATQQMSYDAAGRMISETDELGNTTTYTYDAAGRNTSIRDPLGQTTRFAYDAVGNLVARTDRNGQTTTFTFDALRQPLSRTFPDGTTERASYDAAGRQINTVDQAGNVTQFTYDGLRRLTQVTDALGKVTRFAYDESSNRTSITDALGNVTRYTYDGLGRKLSMTLPLGQTERSSYDASGNLLSRTDFNGATTTYSYDALSRLVRRDLPGGESHTFTYTPVGKQASFDDPRGITTITYDLRDRPTQLREPDGTQLQYTYDGRGQRVGLTTPAGTTTYTYDAAGRLTAALDPQGHQTALGYDPQGNLTSVRLGNGIVSNYGYDSLNRLTELTQTVGGTTLRAYTYTLGPAGNRTRVVENTGRSVDYTYDALFRLTGETIGNPSGGTSVTSYAYDAAGNRVSKTDAAGATSSTYDANDRLRSAGAITYAYDDNGNMVGKTEGAGVTTYQYDALNRLLGADFPGGTTAGYSYDALGNRVRSVDAGVTTHYLVDPFAAGGLPQVLRETDGAGARLADYTQAGGLLLSMTRAGGASFYLPDGHWSVSALANDAGQITDRYDYDAFGNLLLRTGTTPNAFLFNGQQLDATLGFYYLRARYYDPNAGRFTARDPFPGSSFDPASLHPYTYANNDPINKSDPSGQLTMLDMALASALVGIVAGIVYGGLNYYQYGDVDVAFGVAGDAAFEFMMLASVVFGIVGVVRAGVAQIFSMGVNAAKGGVAAAPVEGGAAAAGKIAENAGKVAARTAAKRGFFIETNAQTDAAIARLNAAEQAQLQATRAAAEAAAKQAGQQAAALPGRKLAVEVVKQTGQQIFPKRW